MKLEKNKLTIWKVEIDLKLWSIYLMLGAFIQLFLAFLIWQQNMDLYTISKTFGQSSSALQLEEIKKRSFGIIAICYGLLFIFNGKKIFQKIKGAYKKFKEIMEDEE